MRQKPADRQSKGVGTARPHNTSSEELGTSRPRPEKRHASQQSLNAAVKSICDVMRRSNCAGAMKYVPELTWILFLRILDEREAREAEEAAALGLPFTPALPAPYRWRDWADAKSAMRQDKNASVWAFVHDKLLPHLKKLEKQPGATARQKVARVSPRFNPIRGWGLGSNPIPRVGSCLATRGYSCSNPAGLRHVRPPQKVRCAPS